MCSCLSLDDPSKRYNQRQTFLRLLHKFQTDYWIDSRRLLGQTLATYSWLAETHFVSIPRDTLSYLVSAQNTWKIRIRTPSAQRA
jgi:hypothetical protein